MPIPVFPMGNGGLDSASARFQRRHRPPESGLPFRKIIRCFAGVVAGLGLLACLVFGPVYWALVHPPKAEKKSPEVFRVIQNHQPGRGVYGLLALLGLAAFGGGVVLRRRLRGIPPRESSADGGGEQFILLETPEPERSLDSSALLERLQSEVERVSSSSVSAAWLESVWVGRVRRRALRLRNIGRNLRLWRRFRLHPLRRESLDLRVSAGQIPDCAACEELCCIGPRNTISLRLEDLARLLDADLEWAISRHKPIYSRELLQKYPSLREIERLTTYRCFPVLRQRADGSCVFLTRRGRCAIYAIRPLRCRRFPYRLDAELKAIVYSSACKSFRRDGTPWEVEAMAEAVTQNYNAKIRDLLML